MRRIDADGGLAGQHDRVDRVVDGVGRVAHFGARRPQLGRIESNTCVATITGRPRRRARRVISFCTAGTRSNGISSPRIPARDHHRVGGAEDGVEVVDRGGPLDLGDEQRPSVARSATMTRAMRRSSAVWTKLSATMSTPRDRPKRRSAMSLGVSAEAGRATPGRLMPLCSASAPPPTTTVFAVVPSDDSTRSSMRPSSSSR